MLEVVPITSEVIPEGIVHKPGVFISVADTFLVMVRQNEPMIRIYSTNKNKLLGEFGRKGGGRNDFEAPALIKFPTGQSSEKPMVAMFDWLKARVTYIDLLSYFNGSDDFLFHYNFPVQLFGGPPGGFYTAHKKFMFVGHNSFSKQEEINRFAVLNMETGEINLMPLAPGADFPINESIAEDVYRSHVAYNEDKNLIAAIPWFLGRIDFFNEDLEFQFSSVYRNLDDNLVALSAGKIEKKGQTVHSLHDFKGNVLSYTYTNDYLFLLCNEDKYGDVYDGRYSNMYLRVFNWAGKQISVFSLNANVNSSFSYDYIHHRLYVYDSFKDDDNLMMYDLPTF